MAINKDNVLDDSWNNVSLLEIRTALQALLTDLGDSIEAAQGGKPVGIELSLDGNELTASVTLADGETELSASIDLTDVISAGQAAVEIVNNLVTDSGTKALSAAMGLKLDRKTSVVLEHMHWAAGTPHVQLNAGVHKYYYSDADLIFHFYGKSVEGQGQPQLVMEYYEPSAFSVYLDNETSTLWRFLDGEMVMVYNPWCVIGTATTSSVQPSLTDGSSTLYYYTDTKKLNYCYRIGNTTYNVLHDPDKSKVYSYPTSGGSKAVRWNGTQWVDVGIDTSTLQPRLLAGTGISINSNNQISVETGSVAANEDKPVSGNDVFQALDGITAGQTVVINSDGANIIDDYSDSVLIATSARKVKELYLNLQQLYSDLANMAFTNGKPSWISVAKRQYDLSLASSGNDGLSEVYIVNGENDEDELTTTATKVNEGAVKLRLVPTASNLAFTHIIVNGVDIAQTAVDAGKSDGSVYVTFILNADATISATATSGVTVNMGSSTNCSMNTTSQAVDENFSRQITASSHYTLPSAITVKLNGSTTLASGTDYTYTRANDNKTATLEIDKSKFANASSIEVTCVATPVASCTVTWSKIDMIVKHGNDVLFNNETLETPSHTVYADELNYALTFEAATGKKFTTAPNISGTDLTGSNGVYTLTVDSVTNDITVDAVVGNLQMYSVALPSIGNGVASVELKDINNNTIEPVGGVYNVPENSSIKAIITPSTFYGLSVDDTNSSMANSQVGWHSDANGIGVPLEVSIPSLTGDVVLAVTAKDYNICYENIRYQHNGTGSGVSRAIVWGNNAGYAISPLYYIGDKTGKTLTFAAKSGNKDALFAVYLLNDNFGLVEISTYSAAPKSFTVDSSHKYVRMTFKKSDVASCYIKLNAGQSDEEPLFNGADFAQDAVYGSIQEFFEYPFTTPFTKDENGNLKNVGFVNGSNTTSSTFFDNVSYIGNYYSWAKFISNTPSALTNIRVSPMIDLPANGEVTDAIEFDLGGTYSSTVPALLLYGDNAHPLVPTSYLSANQQPRQYTFPNRNYIKFRVVFDIINEAYVKNIGADEPLWSWTPAVEQSSNEE